MKPYILLMASFALLVPLLAEAAPVTLPVGGGGGKGTVGSGGKGGSGGGGGRTAPADITLGPTLTPITPPPGTPDYHAWWAKPLGAANYSAPPFQGSSGMADPVPPGQTVGVVNYGSLGTTTGTTGGRGTGSKGSGSKTTSGKGGGGTTVGFWGQQGGGGTTIGYWGQGTGYTTTGP